MKRYAHENYMTFMHKYCQETTVKEDKEKFLAHIIEKSMDECEKDGRQNW